MKSFLTTAIFIAISLNPNMSVLGPTKIDIIGYACDKQIIYFTKTIYSELAEHENTNLYKYHIKNDSLSVIENWCDRHEYRKHKYYILKINDIYPVKWLNEIHPENNPVTFNWLPRVPYYSHVLMKDTLNSPFQINIQKKSFTYTQCYGQDKLPILTQFGVDSSRRLVHIRYKGECNEGNTIDELIYYELKEDSVYSRDLVKNSFLSSK